MAIDFGALFADTERKYGLPSGYLSRTAQIESSLNPSAKNANSSAGGLFQFIDSTANAYGLADRFDPIQATDAAGRLARDNAAALSRRLGRAPTAAELYLAHQQGAGGAAALLANPSALAADVVGGAAAGLNAGGGATAGDFVAQWARKFDGGAGPGPAGGPVPVPAAMPGPAPVDPAMAAAIYQAFLQGKMDEAERREYERDALSGAFPVPDNSVFSAYLSKQQAARKPLQQANIQGAAQ